MKITLTPRDLIAFEEEITALFLDKKIPAPVHLAGGNEEQLIRIFSEVVNEEDWILCSWRSHYHCLLKGVPRDRLKLEIIAGHSISLCFPKYHVLSSGMVGGTAPIGVGLAMGIKRKKENRKVVCFLGDMTYECGIVQESIKYANNYELPIRWIIEDNGLSVGTPTRKTWGGMAWARSNVSRYEYKMTVPHVGVGKWVTF